MTIINEICNTFNKKANEYEKAAKVQQEIGHRLLERLTYLKINPKTILDLGCGPGNFSKELTRMYPKARIVGLDIASSMLALARKKQGWRSKWSLIAADMAHIPFSQGVFDLIFSNQVIHWGSPIEQIFREIYRIMKPNGCFMFTTLGPDTFKELKTCWEKANSYAHVNSFLDMHDVGDLLLSERFVSPVMDMEWLSVHYESVPHLIKNLKNQGVKNINSSRNAGLTGKASWALFEKSYDALRTENKKYPLTYEVVYGHAWKGVLQKTLNTGETLIPLSSIKLTKSE